MFRLPTADMVAPHVRTWASRCGQAHGRAARPARRWRLPVGCWHVSVPHTLTISLLVNELAQHGHTFTQQALAKGESESMEACELDVKAPPVVRLTLFREPARLLFYKVVSAFSTVSLFSDRHAE